MDSGDRTGSEPRQDERAGERERERASERDRETEGERWPRAWGGGACTGRPTLERERQDRLYTYIERERKMASGQL